MHKVQNRTVPSVVSGWVLARTDGTLPSPFPPPHTLPTLLSGRYKSGVCPFYELQYRRGYSVTKMLKFWGCMTLTVQQGNFFWNWKECNFHNLIQIWIILWYFSSFGVLVNKWSYSIGCHLNLKGKNVIFCIKKKDRAIL